MNKLKEKPVNLNLKKISKYNRIKDLPEDWDNNIKDNPYLKRDFLEFIEQAESDNKQDNKNFYIIRKQNGEIDTQFLMCKTIENIGMFTSFKYNVKLNSIYFPFSVSSSACIFGKETEKEAAKYLNSIKGFTLIININDENFLPENYNRVVIPPKCIFHVKWKSFKEYMSDLRSNYRRRYNTALKKSQELKLRFLKNNTVEFTFQMYNLYLDIYNNAAYKLGKVPMEYFKSAQSIIFVLENRENTAEAFAQLRKNNNELIFEYVGFNKKNVIKYDTYLRVLLEIIRYGIENGYESIDMGQTTDETKLKLGCKYKKLYALIRHSNTIINFILSKILSYIEYKPLDESKFHVFKQN